MTTLDDFTFLLEGDKVIDDKTSMIGFVNSLNVCSKNLVEICLMLFEGELSRTALIT